MKPFALTAAIVSALPFFAQAITTPEQAQAVRNAITNVDKINVLKDDEFVFDFKDPGLTPAAGAGGKLISANVKNFAALVGNNLALTIGWMEGCGINSPHTHPRATELLLLLNGTITAGFITENGSRVVLNNVTELSAVVLPKGSIHFQANYGCEPVQFVAALSNEDPGVVQIAQRFLALPPDVVGATLGGLGVEDVSNLAGLIPDNMIAGIKECYDRCKLPYPTNQPTKQQQPGSGTAPPPTKQQPGTPPPSDSKPPQQDYPPPTGGKVHDVIVGKDLGLTFTPDHIEAKVGETVRFHFVSKNHTVTQSSFDDPCMPLADNGFDSGFLPVAAGSPEKVVEYVVENEKPVWFYCRQKAPDAPKSHCQLGMNGGINPPKSGAKSLEAFKSRASQ